MVRHMRRSPNSGATLVEFALVVPVLVLTLVAIFELGMAFRDYLTISYTAREGTRLTAFLGTHVDADCHAVTSMAQGISSTDLERIDRIEIFKADRGGQQLMSFTTPSSSAAPIPSIATIGPNRSPGPPTPARR